MYCRMKQIKAIGLRFFTVYGRPDMAVYKFIHNIEHETPITVFGDGTMMRDFTYIDDIIDGICSCIFVDITEGTHKIYNLGNNKPVSLNQLISHIEVITGKKAIINYVDIPRGEVPITYANIDKATKELGFSPRTEIEQGFRFFNYAKKKKKWCCQIGFFGGGGWGGGFAKWLCFAPLFYTFSL